MISDSSFCSELTRDDGTMLAGTAAQADVWILLEYRGAWRANAVDDNDLPQATQAWLRDQTTQNANSRAVLIRRAPQRSSIEEHRCYIAITRENDQRLYCMTFTEYAALHSLAVADVVAGSQPDLISDENLVLVCTNGKRDRCCAVFGRPVYEAFSSEAGVSAWQSTHLGGHRYAAVAAVFPAGIYYGYLNPETVSAVAETVRNQSIHLPTYRGRVFYSGMVSAGEYFLRQATGVSEVAVISAETLSDDQHLITFESANGRHTVRLAATMSEPVFVGCTANKYKPQPVYSLRQIVHVQK